MSEESNKIVIFLVLGIIFFFILIFMIVTLSRFAPEKVNEVINKIKELLGFTV